MENTQRGMELAAVRQTLEVSNSKIVLLEALLSPTGRSNNLCMMGLFLKIFRFNLNRDIRGRLEIPGISQELSALAQRDLLVSTGFLLDKEWCPIEKEPTVATLFAICLTSNAAGLPGNKKWNSDTECAVVGFDHKGSMVMVP
jgi:hypothetical protein